MNFRYNSDCIGIIGASQQGKTFLAKQIISNIDKNKVYVIENAFNFSGNRINVPKPYSPKNLDEAIRKFRKLYDKLFVIDDVDNYVPYQSKEFTALAIDGRHQNLGLIYISHRVKGIDKRVLFNTDYLFLSYGVVREDLDYINSVYDIDYGKYNSITKNSYVFYLIDFVNHSDGLVRL